MADAVLWLGGSFSRGYKAAEVALGNPATTLIVSSESSPRRCLQLLLDAGLARDRIVLDYQAWDTVTNFTKTWPIVKRLGAKRVFVVTDGFHMKRSMAIARIVYAGRCVRPIASPSSQVSRQERAGLVRGDCLRALGWRLSGQLSFDEQVYSRRWTQIEADGRIAAGL